MRTSRKAPAPTPMVQKSLSMERTKRREAREASESNLGRTRKSEKPKDISPLKQWGWTVGVFIGIIAATPLVMGLGFAVIGLALGVVSAGIGLSIPCALIAYQFPKGKEVIKGIASNIREAREEKKKQKKTGRKKTGRT